MSKADWGKYAWMRDYWWSIYLVMAVLFVIFSFRIIGDLGRGWTELEQNRREIEEGHQKAEVLKKKLAVLGAAPEEELRQNLARLILAVPASKQLFAAVAELKLAATVAGVKLDKYSARVGEIREATTSAQATAETSGDLEISVNLAVFDLFGLKDFLATLERLLPIVRVKQISYTSGKVEMMVGQPVSPWEKQSLNIDAPLPDYREKIAQVIRKLELYESLPRDLGIEVGEEAAT